jgi:site-specific DNA recombinase
MVAYLSRFGRSLADAMAAIKRITDAGGTFVSIQEGLDLSTDAGRLLLRLLLSIAEWERDRTRTSFQDACDRAVARGVAPGGVPFGYRRGDDRRLEPHPEYAPVVVELFRRRAAGIFYSELAGWLTQSGVRSDRKPTYWREFNFGYLFQRRVYRGELYYGRFVNARPTSPWSTRTPGRRHRRGTCECRLSAPPTRRCFADCSSAPAVSGRCT